MTESKRPSARTWHMTECNADDCVGAQHIDGMHQGGCVPCHCEHTLERHYQSVDDEGCIECNAESIHTGGRALCRGFRSVLTAEARGSSQIGDSA